MKKQIHLIGGFTNLFYKQVVSILFLALFLAMAIPASSQAGSGKDEAFKKTLRDRSAKIVAGLGIQKERKKEKITRIIADQYYALNKVHDNPGDTREKTPQLEALHARFISKLNNKLTKDQVEKVKNGMTYNVLNVTFTAYKDMILTLTDEQKQKIYNWLVEAREKAMMEGSSETKHKMFGKYKGKINNYLSGEGYDMKAEEKAWQQRLREKRGKEAAGEKQQPA